jgi:type II secretory pathway pseudopilin PulG
MSLVELMVTITIISSIAAMIIPATQGDDLLQARSAATILRSDIELTQIMTMTNPSDPMVIQFNKIGTRYWIASAASPETPVSLNSTSDAYLMTIGEGRLAAANGVTIDAASLPGNRLSFDMNGAVFPPMSESVITLHCGNDWIQLDIAPMTGSITDLVGVTSP